MKDKLRGGVDLTERVMLIGKVVGELEFEPSNNAIPEFGLESASESSTLLGLRDSSFFAEELGDGTEGTIVLPEVVERADAELEAIAHQLVHCGNCPLSLVLRTWV